jgi:hypothetical protein
MAEMLAYRMAQQHVNSFDHEGEELIKDHHEAMDCFDCEAFLQLGIDAFHWLILADETLRRAIFSGKREFDPKIQQTIEGLFVAWLRPWKRANEWVDVQVQRGFEVANLDEFLKCSEEVLAVAESLDRDTLTDAMRELRDAALTEHRDGKTAEFV